MESSISGELKLGHLLAVAGIAPSDVLVIRHTYNADGLASEADLTDEKIMAYTRRQSHRNKVGAQPPGLWLSFIAEGGLRSRFLTAHDNFGEVSEESDAPHRYFNLRISHVFENLRRRLTIEWSRDAVNWAKRGHLAESFRVLEIADPQREAFPGFDNLVIDFPTLGLVIEDARYREWRTALESVQGIYLITDRNSGRQYVGKADGRERILGRWRSYWKSGHGGNVALRKLSDVDMTSSASFQFSLLRVFGPEVPEDQLNSAESHFKTALLTRDFGFNKN